MQFPSRLDIFHPMPHLRPEVAPTASAIMTAAVLRLRKTPGTRTDESQRLSDLAVEIFHLLAGHRLDEGYLTGESLMKALTQDAKDSLECIEWVCTRARRLPIWIVYQRSMQSRLDGEAATIVAKWKGLANESPSRPATRLPVRTRAPGTATRERIEGYLNTVEEVTGKEVNKRDFWLRPMLGGTSRYSSDREFRLFQKEDPSLKEPIRRLFGGVLKLAPEQFVEGLEERRRAHLARKNKANRR